MKAGSRPFFVFYCSIPVFILFSYLISLLLSRAGAPASALIAVTLGVFSFAAAFSLFSGDSAADSRQLYITAGLMYLFLLLRIFLFDNETGDYTDFLSPWTDYFRRNGGLAALSQSIGNYNIPYLFFLALFSYLPFGELYLIKLLSVGFDLLLAVSSAKLVLLATGSRPKYLACFVITLILPTVLLNGSYWGQCDSIYAALAIYSLYLILSSRPAASMAALALSFSFKLQAVFIFPIFAVFLFTKRLKLRYLPVFPAVYLAAVSPALIAGRPFWDTLLLYVNQGGTVGSGLNYSSPSVFALSYHYSNPELLSKLGIAAAFLICAVLIVLLTIFSRRLSVSSYVVAAALFCLSVPLFLPHMHDRYFFLSDVLSLTAAFCFPSVSFCVPLCSFASLLGYYAYLCGRYLMHMRRGFFALCIVFIAYLTLLVCEIRKSGSSDAAAKQDRRRA